MPAQQISNSFIVEVAGNPLPADVDVSSVVVDDHLLLPDSFAITFRDGPRIAISKSGATIGGTVKISVLSDASPSPQPLLVGEITAMEAEIYGGSSFTVIRGYDQSHRLFRGHRTKSFEQMTYSEIAQQVAKTNSMTVGEVTSTSVQFDHVTQWKERDWDFLNRIARDIGFEVSVSDGKLNFRKPKPSTSAPGPADLHDDDDLRMQVGANLLFLRAVLTAAEQVQDVEVRSWDPKEKKAVTSQVKATTESIHNASGPDKMAAAFPSQPLISAGVPYATSGEVEAAAKALADEVASSFAEMEGQARGNPKLRAGVAVHLGLLGDPFDGKYVLTSTRHSHDADEGYVTGFVISGRQERSMLGLTSGGSGTTTATSVDGVIVGMVDDVDDPQKSCRVKVRFPSIDDTFVSDWSRVVSAGAGKNRGTVIVPEVGDEVLVAFEQGDARRPYVIGGLYNGVDTPNIGPGSLLDDSSHAVNNRLFTSRLGHQLVFQDGTDQSGIIIQTAGGTTVTLDEKHNKLVIKTGGDITMNADGGITIEAKGSLALKGQSVTVEGQSSLSAKGAQVSVEASGPAKVAGNPIQLN